MDGVCDEETVSSVLMFIAGVANKHKMRMLLS